LPIISSVSEHQPITWSTYAFDLHFLIILLPVGAYYVFNHFSDGGCFIILYAVAIMYFSSSMVRLVLVCAPLACSLAGTGVSWVINVFMAALLDLKATSKPESSSKSGKRVANASDDGPAFSYPKEFAAVMVIATLLLLFFYVLHCNWVTSEGYSSPSIVLQSRTWNGGLIVFDDFREAYYWLRYNTHPSARIMSWWDYGYQISAMGNRTVIVDNNTRNNTHIAQVGTAMASNEDMALPIIRSLNVDYVLVIFGGMIGYSGDDINKFLWMVRIGGGVNPRIQEPDYFTPQGHYSIGDDASETMKNCLMYRLCYFNFDRVQTSSDRQPGFDRARDQVVGVKNIKLKYFEEAFTSQHWMVRIYKVKPDAPRDAPEKPLKPTRLVKQEAARRRQRQQRQ